jgi:hypothetical protein
LTVPKISRYNAGYHYPEYFEVKAIYPPFTVVSYVGYNFEIAGEMGRRGVREKEIA